MQRHDVKFKIKLKERKRNFELCFLFLVLRYTKYHIPYTGQGRSGAQNKDR